MIYSFKEKVVGFLINLLGKNIKSRFCSYRKIITKDILSSASKILFISNFATFYEILKFQQPVLLDSDILFIDNVYRKYFWTLEKIKAYLFNKKNKNIKTCIIYNCYYINFIKYLHSILPNTTIVCRYHDIVTTKNDILTIQKIKKLSYCICESYCEKDAKHINIKFFQNSVNFNNFKKLKTDTIYDIYFLGSVGIERVNKVISLTQNLYKQKISFYFDAISNDKKLNLLKKKLNTTKAVIQTSPVDYKTYVHNLSHSKVIIDLYRLTPDEGLSFRTAEALALKKKIITNRDLNANNLYKFKENILSFDDIDKVNLREFIDKPYVDPNPELLKQFDINEQIKNYLKN